MPSEKIASICVIQLMKTLFRNFITDLRHIQKEDAQIFDETSIKQDVIKIPAITMFEQIGEIFNKELKSFASNSKGNTSLKQKVEKHHIVEDKDLWSFDWATQMKIGAALTNLMCKTLTYSIGKKKYLLLKPQLMRQDKTKELGYIVFNKSFIDHFLGEIDKLHDLNIHIERSLPMIYKPAPWKNYNFGAYYLK